MKSKTLTSKILLLLTIIILSLSNTTLAQTRKKTKEQKQETPNEKFYRQGGKETKAEVISQGYELTTSNIAEKRSLSVYDAGGHFNCREYAKDVNCDFSKIRDFIWQHWQNKQRGYIRVTFDSVDAVSSSHIFIEPDKSGTWHIAWHNHVLTDIPEIIFLEQAKPEKTETDGGKFILVFKNNEGDEIQRL